MNIIRGLFIFVMLISASFLTGCETFKKMNSDLVNNETPDEYRQWDAARFYRNARLALTEGNYPKAIKLYEMLESRYPFGEYAAQTQLDIAYVYYKNEDTESALAAADRFIKLNPRNPNLDYAYYLKGLAYYNRHLNFLTRFLPTDSTQRDPSSGKDAYNQFAELERRFPQSRYLTDAKQRMLALRNIQALYELHVAEFYVKRKAYIAAINRINYLLKDYPRSSATPIALQLLAESYTQLGLNDLAIDAQKIYQLNYPQGHAHLVLNEPTVVENIWNFIGLDN
ncbi:MAG: outer membrane protein assembly factor BamD [Pseudomonadota bacterium]|jgi:outer membrane protein assembly factor BamD